MDAGWERKEGEDLGPSNGRLVVSHVLRLGKWERSRFETGVSSLVLDT